uniref:Uncharacterized protein n=1 Tax=Monopterus albus TaxID=43700 RepID=A0A3Q3JJI5_MONAL
MQCVDGTLSDTFSVMCFLSAEAIGDMSICYILDGILILYGIILTVLYCRLRVRQTGLMLILILILISISSCVQSTDTYETIKVDKKPMV